MRVGEGIGSGKREGVPAGRWRSARWYLCAPSPPGPFGLSSPIKWDGHDDYNNKYFKNNKHHNNLLPRVVL